MRRPVCVAGVLQGGALRRPQPACCSNQAADSLSEERGVARAFEEIQGPGPRKGVERIFRLPVRQDNDGYRVALALAADFLA